MTPRDRRDVADKIVIQLVVERRVHRVLRSRQEERVAVGRGTHDGLGSDSAASPRPVVDDKWLAETLRQPLTHQTGDDVETTPCRSSDDEAHRYPGHCL